MAFILPRRFRSRLATIHETGRFLPRGRFGLLLAQGRYRIL
jgi:hypothetical protein